MVEIQGFHVPARNGAKQLMPNGRDMEAQPHGEPRLLKRLRYDVLALLLVYVASRLVLYTMGIRVSTEHLMSSRLWQYLDFRLLQETLLESLWYYHAQPPLLNAYHGIMVQIFGTGSGLNLAFYVSAATLGAVFVVCLYSLMRGLGVYWLVAFAVATGYSITPAFVLYGNWLFYTFPTTAFLCIATYLLYAWLGAPKSPWAMHGFFWSLAIIALTRSVFHLFWMVGLVACCVLLHHRDYRRILIGACLPCAVVLFVYAKNMVLFGSFAASTWMGMNLSNATTMKLLTMDTRRELVSRGELTEFALITPFSDLPVYEPLLPPHTPWGVACLDMPRVSSNRVPNYNHVKYIYISRQYLRDSWRTIRAKPVEYATSIMVNLDKVFLTPEQFWFLDDNQKVIEPWRVWYLRNVQGVPAGRSVTWWTYLRVGYYVALLALPVLIVRRWAAGRKTDAIVLLFMLFNIVYISFVGNAVERDEGFRFRYMVTPFCTVVLTVVAQDLVSATTRGTGSLLRRLRKRDG